MAGRLFLGIDTGGTHTDAVVFDPQGKAVLAAAKAITTHHDLSLGISEVLARLMEKKWPGGLESIERINLSTTLATNAVAEGQGSPVGLLMIGYDCGHDLVLSLVSRLPLVTTRFFSGGHDFYGREIAAVDEEAIRAAVEALELNVRGWAVSSMFAIKNPEHELKAASIIQSISQKPITLARDLTGQYDAVRRAATAALNAGLVPVINRLLDSVKKSAAGLGLEARLMVVKGDGSLASEEWARERPIETVVSGPAASALGVGVLGRGLLLSPEENIWVMDVGGTTTDLAYLKEGRPKINPNGARIGTWHTMSTAVQTGTRGLGGDSRVELKPGPDGLNIGPRRVLPLCRLAEEWPEVIRILKGQKFMTESLANSGIFLLRGAAAPDETMSSAEKELYEALPPDGPLILADYLQKLRRDKRYFPGIKMIDHPAIAISAFTPTDTMSVLGLYTEGFREAAVLGAELAGRALKINAEEVASLVLNEFGRLLAQEIVVHSFEQADIKYDQDDFASDGLLGDALKRRRQEGVELVFQATATVFLLGGPAGALAPFLARYLKGRIIVPPTFDTANAAGAAAAPISLSREVEIHMVPGKGYRLFLPEETLEGWSVVSLTEVARQRMTDYMSRLAVWAGVSDPQVQLSIDDRKLLLPNGRSLHMGAGLKFTVYGSETGTQRAGHVRPKNVEDSPPPLSRTLESSIRK